MCGRLLVNAEHSRASLHSRLHITKPLQIAFQQLEVNDTELLEPKLRSLTMNVITFLDDPIRRRDSAVFAAATKRRRVVHLSHLI
jgi:hypothetical protein